MKYPTVFFIFCCCFLSQANTYPSPVRCVGRETETLPNTAPDLHTVLWQNLLADNLIQDEAQMVKIEFEFHDIFVNERILSYELIDKYHQLLISYGVSPGPQRQIHLFNNGKLLIGDVNAYGQLFFTTTCNKAVAIFNK